jgi:hypothetical protein
MSIVKIQEELKAPKNQRNNFGGYNYRSAEDIIEAVKPIAHKYGYYLIISDEIVEVGGRIYVKATARLQPNEAGNIYSATGWAREEETKKGMDGAQITGAASSYARKYALNGLLAIDDTKDADATNTHGKEESNNANLVIKTEGSVGMAPPTASLKAPSVRYPSNNSAKPEDDKAWLNKNNPKWSLIVQQFKTGENNINNLRKEFKVSKAVEAELTALSV